MKRLICWGSVLATCALPVLGASDVWSDALIKLGGGGGTLTSTTTG